jgi:hypothetical protein
MPKHDILEDPAGEGDAGNGGSVRSVKLIGAPTQRRRRSATRGFPVSESA